MESYIIISLIVLAIFLLARMSAHSTNTKKVFKNNIYKYTAKRSLMTPAEDAFFIKLQEVVQDKYYVFPQVHLSAILDHRVKGQEWKYAFRHINGKSVDYVLCSKATLKPTYAIELDDYTHSQADRRERDVEVERIFAAANLPLVRFKNNNVSERDIIHALSDANELVNG